LGPWNLFSELSPEARAQQLRGITTLNGGWLQRRGGVSISLLFSRKLVRAKINSVVQSFTEGRQLVA
jgi:hypothetical protein